MISVIGLGGAGGNIADVAANNGLLAGAINFSQKDLESLENVKYKLRINGSDGVGHDRSKAIKLFSEQHETAINFINDNFSDQSNEMLVFAFACGGGSGSGIAPILIDLVSNLLPEKVVVALPILPDYSESTVSQLNTIKAFEELSSVDVCVLPLDNQQIKTKYNIEGKGKLYQTSNHSIINMLKKILHYTESYSKNGNFDKKDFLTVFNQKGIGVIGETDVISLQETNDLLINKNGISVAIQESWKNSIFSQIEYYKVIKSAIIVDAKETILEFTDHNEIFSKFDCGLPIDIFEGLYHEQQGYILTILTGLSWCKTRLMKIEELIEQKQDNIQKALSEEEEYKPKSFDSILQIKPKSKPKKSFKDILNKYRD